MSIINLITLPMLILWAFSHFGLAYIVGHSLISVGVRRWLYERRPFLVDLLECPACFGFWSGGLVGFALSLMLDSPHWFFVVPGIFTSGCNRILAHFADLDRSVPDAVKAIGESDLRQTIEELDQLIKDADRTDAVSAALDNLPNKGNA